MRNLFAVIGDPIGHSLSPIMHEKWLKENKLNHYYHAFQVTKADLEAAVKAFRVLGVKGFNVTIPHKMAIIPYLDEIDNDAKVLGAVNTVLNVNGRLIGSNTDGKGFIESLHANGFKVAADSSVLIIGAGGAARAVGMALARHFHVPIDITNRSLEKAEALAEEVSQFTFSRALSLDHAGENLSKYQMIIQATPVGMSGFEDELPITIEHLEAATQCVDLIYKPLETRFLTIAKSKGCRVMNGLPMLIHQGAAAFKYWLGIDPNTKEMEPYLIQKLNNKEAH